MWLDYDEKRPFMTSNESRFGAVYVSYNNLVNYQKRNITHEKYK